MQDKLEHAYSAYFYQTFSCQAETQIREIKAKPWEESSTMRVS